MFILEVNICVMTVCSVRTLYAMVCSSVLYCDLVLENTMKNRIYAYEKLLQFIYTRIYHCFLQPPKKNMFAGT